MKFWGHSSYPKENLAKGFSYTAQKKKYVNISSRKQKTKACRLMKWNYQRSPGWVNCSPTQCEKMPWWSGSLFHSPWTREEAVRCGHLWLLRPVSLRGVLHGKLKSRRRKKNESARNAGRRNRNTRMLAKDRHLCRPTGGLMRKSGKGWMERNAFLKLNPSPAGPGKNKHKVALSIPSVAGPNLSISVGLQAWAFLSCLTSQDAMPSLQGQNPFERNPILKIFEN